MRVGSWIHSGTGLDGINSTTKSWLMLSDDVDGLRYIRGFYTRPVQDILRVAVGDLEVIHNLLSKYWPQSTNCPVFRL